MTCTCECVSVGVGVMDVRGVSQCTLRQVVERISAATATACSGQNDHSEGTLHYTPCTVCYRRPLINCEILLKFVNCEAFPDSQ